MKLSSQRAVVLCLTLFSVVYAAGVFAFAFFRHDDWLILGNSVAHLPRDWSFAWRPTLFFHGREGDWFFRPFFKLGVYAFYQAFGFHYRAWLCALLLVT